MTADGCSSSPCVGGATCHPDWNNQYYCECPADRSGPNCEHGKNVDLSPYSNRNQKVHKQLEIDMPNMNPKGDPTRTYSTIRVGPCLGSAMVLVGSARSLDNNMLVPVMLNTWVGSPPNARPQHKGLQAL